MNNQIQSCIEEECLKFGLTNRTKSDMDNFDFTYWNDTASVEVRREGQIYRFEMYDYRIHHKPLFSFPIPETLRGFMQVCNILKIFHNH